MSNDFWLEVESMIKVLPKVTLEYRIYYDEEGNIISCSMTNHPESGKYIVATKQEYNTYFNYRVIKERLVKIDHDARYRVQLTKSTEGFPVVQGHAGLLIEDEEYTDIEYYARTN